MADRHDQRLAAILRNGWPEPRPGLEDRMVAALRRVRPRRHPNLVPILVAILILLALAAATFATARYFLEERLHFTDVWGYTEGARGEVMSSRTVGMDLGWESAGKQVTVGRNRTDLSPDGKKWAFHQGNVGIGPRMRKCDLYLADADGSHARNVSQAAGLGGINCSPYWSPDGRMIYFAHVDPVQGQTPCQAHFEPWLMRADGSGAHRLTPKGSPMIWPGQVRWSPDSTRLLSCWQTDIYDYDSFLVTAFTVDVRSNKTQVLPNVGNWPRYSPDGSQIASLRYEPDTVKGEKGYWNQLLLTDADGRNPQVLVQQFIADATARARYLDKGQRQTTGYDWIAQFRSYAGPRPVAWSPKGNQIAFLAALPYNPKVQGVEPQIEVWVYDLRAEKAIRITHDNVEQGWVGWK